MIHSNNYMAFQKQSEGSRAAKPYGGNLCTIRPSNCGQAVHMGSKLSPLHSLDLMIMGLTLLQGCQTGKPINFENV